MKQEISYRFELNIKRVKNLVYIYRMQLAGQGRGRRGHQQTDVLRAATVLLHASLEDVLRSLAYWKLPTAIPQVLDQIPLLGGGNKPKSVTLGSLSTHRGKSVDDVIKESVNAYLERSNYNNTGEVCQLLESIGLDINPVQSHLGMLNTVMARRHQIVHRADANSNASGRGNYKVLPIAPDTVDTWITNTENFAQVVLNQV